MMQLDMGEIMVLYYIIIIVMGILSIFLFFKVWGMTNDVDRISEDVRKIAKNSSQNDTKEVARAILKKDPNTENILFDALYNDLCRGYMERRSSPENTLNRFQRIYKRLNIPFPAVFENIESYKDFEQLVNSATNPKEQATANDTHA